MSYYLSVEGLEDPVEVESESIPRIGDKVAYQIEKKSLFLNVTAIHRYIARDESGFLEHIIFVVTEVCDYSDLSVDVLL